jgi:hypothetical protein
MIGINTGNVSCGFDYDFIINYDIKCRMGLSADQAGGTEEDI